MQSPTTQGFVSSSPTSQGEQKPYVSTMLQVW